MIEIEEPPDIRACALGVPLVWMWSLRARKWKSYEPVDEETDTIRRHKCERHGDVDPPWRQLSFNDEPDPGAIAVAHAGAERVRQVLGAAAVRPPPPNEGDQRG